MRTAQETYAMLEQQSLWDVAMRAHQALQAKSLAHALVGGVAVCLHGYRRSTVDVDLLIRREDGDAARGALEENGFAGDPSMREFRDATDIPVQFISAGESAGAGSEVFLPNPEDGEVVKEIEGLPVLSLARLIEIKIACGEGNVRRSHKDFADVVELILNHQLHSGFAGYLHKSLRRTFKRLVKNAHGMK